MKAIKLLMIFNLIISFYPSKGQTTNNTNYKDCKIEIFLLKKTTSDTSDLCRFCFTPRKEDLADTVFINNKEIIGYEINKDSQNFLLSQSCMARLQNLKDFPVRCAFAVVVNDKPVYGGWFLSRFVSNFHMCDWIHVFSPFGEDGKKKLTVKLGPWPQPTSVEWIPDPRVDLRNEISLMECLSERNRLIIPLPNKGNLK